MRIGFIQGRLLDSEKRNAITAYVAFTDYQMGKNLEIMLHFFIHVFFM